LKTKQLMRMARQINKCTETLHKAIISCQTIGIQLNLSVVKRKQLLQLKEFSVNNK